MKIIFLNIWGGKVFDPLMKFVKESAADTDFFCFQEVFDSPHEREVSWGGRANMLAELTRGLPEFKPCFASAVSGFDGDNHVDYELSLGLAIFVREGITVESSGDFLICGEEWTQNQQSEIFPHNLQFARFRRGIKMHTIVNVHGVAYPGSKLDTPERRSQSQKIVEFLNREKSEKILGGDFNLMPDTESIRMIERAGMRSMIKEFNIRTTRSILSYARYPETDRQHFSDYVFVSPGVGVSDFRAPQISISDHLPMVLGIA